MARLPLPGSDNGNWGDILNDYLSQAHAADGSIKPASVQAAISSASITKSQLSSSIQVSLDNADAAASGTLADNSVSTSKLQDNAVTTAKIADGTILNADINVSAAIAQTKLNLSITNAEVNASAAIAKSKLAALNIGDSDINTISPSKVTGTAVITTDSRLSDTRTPTDNSVTSAKIVDGTIVNADISASAAIAQSKLSLDIVNANINASAAIAKTKLASDVQASLSATDTSPTIRALADTPIDSSPPTITVQTSSGQLVNATSTITGTRILPDGATNKARYNAFRYEAFSSPWSGTPSYAARAPKRVNGSELTDYSPQLYSIDFDHYGDEFELAVIGDMQIRVITNGRYASATPTAGAADDNWRNIKVTYGSVTLRRIRIETGVSATSRFGNHFFGGIKIKTGQLMLTPTQQQTKKFAIVWDSFGNGGTATGADLRSATTQMARILGFNNYYGLCIAGSGLTLPSNEVFLARVADLTAMQPEYIFLPGSVNDFAAAGTTLPAAAAAFYAAVKTACPNARIVASGAFDASVVANGNVITAVLKTAAQNAGLEFIDTTGWVLPTGLADPGDNYHPTPTGHDHIARRYGAELLTRWTLPY